jgi:hypothetical protein
MKCCRNASDDGHDDSAGDERDATGWLNYIYATA